jgi:hypothetical protein
MSKGKKRVTITPKGNTRDGNEKAEVYPGTYKKRGIEYPCYFVRGWREKGKWQKKQFSNKAKAEAEAATVNMKLKNTGQHRALVLSTLSEKQTQQAERALHTLGDTYSLDDAVQFFLDHHRPPEFTINITDGLDIYLADKKREGVRTTTTDTTSIIIKAFARYAGDPLVHTVTKSSITAFLKTLRSKDKKSPAKKKTWNNYRNELASFFIWAGSEDLATSRPWTFNNPTEGVQAFSTKRVAEERPPIATTSPEAVKALFAYLMNYKEGKMVKWFALAYFAGIRPSTNNGELAKLSAREDELINLTTGRIMLPSDMTKTKHSRPIKISANLKAWLEAYKDLPIIPTNLKHDYAEIREKFKLQQDETRHSFISYHIALNRSVGDTALEAGNSESMIKKHYLNHHSQEEGKDFFSIVPDMDTGQAVYSESTQTEEEKYKVI